MDAGGQQADAGTARRWLTINEAAERLGIGRTKVYELIARGELRSIQIDGSRRVPSHWLEEYMEGIELEAVAGMQR